MCEHIDRELKHHVRMVFLTLCAAAKECDIDLATAVTSKMKLAVNDQVPQSDSHSFHSLTFALCAKVGELSEAFRPKHEDASIDQLTSNKKNVLACKFADVMISLLGFIGMHKVMNKSILNQCRMMLKHKPLKLWP